MNTSTALSFPPGLEHRQSQGFRLPQRRRLRAIAVIAKIIDVGAESVLVPRSGRWLLACIVLTIGESVLLSGDSLL